MSRLSRARREDITNNTPREERTWRVFDKVEEDTKPVIPKAKPKASTKGFTRDISKKINKEVSKEIKSRFKI